MKHLFFLFILVLLASCGKEKVEPTTCGTEDPASELPWLKAEIDRITKANAPETKFFYVMQAEYNHEVVFYIGNCCPYCTTIILHYDCLGKLIENVDHTKVVNDKIVWKPKDFACSLM